MSSVPPEGYPPHVPVPPPPPVPQQAPQQTAYQQPVQYPPQGHPQQYAPQGQAPAQYQAPAPQYAPQGQYPPAQQGYPQNYQQQQQYYDQNAGFATQPAPRRGGVNPTPIVLGVVGVAVVAGLVWAVTAMMGPKEDTPIVGSDTAGTSEGSGSEEGNESPEESEMPETEARPVITGAELVLPEGPAPTSDRDHPEAAAQVFDGDPTTYWYTSTYTSSDFGGSGGGSGVALTLEAKAAVTTFELSTNSTGGHVEIRATSATDPAGGEVVAEGPVQQGTTTFTADKPVTADSFVVWVTELPESAPLEGKPELKYRIELNEVTLS